VQVVNKLKKSLKMTFIILMRKVKKWSVCLNFGVWRSWGMKKGLNERERRKRASQKKEEKGKRQRE